MKPTVHFFINRSGLKLRFLTWGNSNHSPIILLHGLRSYAMTWHQLAPILVQNNFYVIALDQRGRGESDWAVDYQTYQTQYYVADLEDLVQHLNIAKTTLLGHSLGGVNVLAFAKEHPQIVDRLIVEDIGPGSSISGAGAERIRHEMESTPLSFNDWSEAAAFWQKLRPLIDQNGIQSRLKYTLVEVDGVIKWRHDQEGIAKARLSIPSTDLWPMVDALVCPTLFIKGGLSDFLSDDIISRLKIRKPELNILTIDGASHYVHDDQPAQFNQFVLSFLQHH